MEKDLQAQRPLEPRYGNDLIPCLPGSLLEKPIVLTQPEPWELVKDCFKDGITQVSMVDTMDHDRIAAQTEIFGTASAVIGIGGGSALDHAKFTAWKTGLPLVLVPSILSVDAAYTPSIAVRKDSRVRYVGSIRPDFLLVDYDLIQRAPAFLNRSGAGDILSIFTALWDWREAWRRLGERYDPLLAGEAQTLLDRLFNGAAHLRDVSEEGLHLLSELYIAEVSICEAFGNARPEEGSEHYIAYCLEAITQRSFIHGQLIGLCILLAGSYQGQDITPVRDFLDEIGLDCRLKAVGTSRDEIRHTLLSMGDYIRQETQIFPGVFHFRGGITETDTDDVLSTLEEIIE